MNTLSIAVKSDWDHFYAIVHTEDDWITPLLNAVEGIGVEEAFWRPGGEVASIADIVVHLTGHFEATLRSVLGMAEQDYEDWPATPEPSAASWQSLMDRLKLTVADLNRALHNWSFEEIYGVPRGHEARRSTMMTNILVHNAYHAGQIVKLRQAFATQRLAALS